jgi:hypothetical protein
MRRKPHEPQVGLRRGRQYLLVIAALLTFRIAVFPLATLSLLFCGHGGRVFQFILRIFKSRMRYIGFGGFFIGHGIFLLP